MNAPEFLCGVTIFEGRGSAALAVAGSLLKQLGGQHVSSARDARLMLLSDQDAHDSRAQSIAPHASQSVARIEGELDDLLLQAAAGICAGIGSPGRPPLKLPLDQSAKQGGLVLAIAACAALFCPEPQQISLSLLDVWAAFYTGPDVANARFGRSKTRRGGQRAPGNPWPRTILPCKDGYFAIQCATREHWQRFLHLLEKPELEAAAIFADRIKANDLYADEADGLFADWFGARTKAQILQAFLSAKIPGAPVYQINEVAAHDHLRERAAFGPGLEVKLPFALTAGSRRSNGTSQTRSARAPLAGMRVVDFGWVWAGAVPGHVLADLGAEVIKIETATRLDYMRQGRPIIGTQRDPEQNPMFAAVNRSKLSFRIDMRQPEGAALLRELIAKSDVVIENFSPGVLDRQGLGWNDLAALAPGLIMCSMSAAGATGPLRDIRTYATMIAGLSGLDSMVGYHGERVLGSQSSYCDPNASLHATLAILAALYARERSGEGCWIDLSQWQAGLHAVDAALAHFAAAGSIPGPHGLAHEDRLVHGCFPTASDDEWIAISVHDGADLEALRAALDIEAATDEAISAATARADAETLLRRLPPRIAARVARPSEVADDPRVRSGNLFEENEHPVLGALPVYRLPWRVNGERIAIRSHAPLLGEHNDYVLGDILHLPAERIRELTQRKVFT